MRTRRACAARLSWIAALLALGLCGCEELLMPQAQVTGGLNSEGMGGVLAVPYNGPRARLAVVAFDNKAGKGERIGEGMAEMLVTELVNTNRYILLERRELGGVLAEQDLAKEGRVSPDTAAPTGQIEGAEILVFGAVTEFEPDYQGTGGTLANTKYGALTLYLKQAHLAIDMRLVDARSSRILSAVSVEGRATDLSAGLLTRVGGGHSRMGIGLAGYRNQPMEKAIRVCLARAVQFVVSQTPSEYCRFDPSGQPYTPFAPVGPGVPGTVGPPQPVYQLPPVTPSPVPQPVPPQPPGPLPAPPPATPPTSPAPTPSAVTNLPPQASVIVQSLQVFQQPNAASPVVTTAAQGTALQVIGQQGNWYAVALPGGQSGWVLKSLTTVPPPAAPAVPGSIPK